VSRPTTGDNRLDLTLAWAAAIVHAEGDLDESEALAVFEQLLASPARADEVIRELGERVEVGA
jgi:hypothetical protein